MMEFRKQLAYELIENEYLEKEEAALQGIGRGLLFLPPYIKFVGTKIVTSMSKPPPPPQCNYCKREVRT